MSRKIFRSIMAAVGLVLLASMVIIVGCMYAYFGSVQEQQLQDGLSLAASAVEQGGEAYLASISSDRYRLTWVAADGRVLFDTRSDGSGMENHAGREEIADALEYGHGSSTRYSTTLMEKTIYFARRLSDGTVLRISVSQVTVAVLVLGMLQPMLIVLAIAFVLSGLLAKRAARGVVEPLNSLDLEHPLENDTYEELAPLLDRINRQHRRIDSQMQELQRRKDEFEQITGSMKEGLVLLNGRGTVLSINRAAQKLFHTTGECVGRDFLTVWRSHEMSLAVQAAGTGGHSEIRMECDGREYQFDLTRIDAEGAAGGVVLLAFDVTEQAFAQRNRREFTANVSHELKTPVQSILGSAELLENGLVKPEDVPQFVGRIRREAERLVVLIQDIIRLSQLDEGVSMPTEPVDLLAAAQEAAGALKDAAEARQVTLRVTGTPCTVPGVSRLISETAFNLCENAIKYNRPGGSVELHVERQERCGVLTVRDTGIGIPPEDQDRVFERFYRVDKSRSSASGGTGLGLSIVKHAVQYHHGRIELESKPGEGTVFRVEFPVSEE